MVTQFGDFGLCNDNLIHKPQLLQNRVVRITTDTSYDSADHPLLLTELGWLNIRQLCLILVVSCLRLIEE